MAKETPIYDTKLRPLEFRLFQEINRDFKSQLKHKRILVACSGGADSVVLAASLHYLSRRFEFSIALAHVHHGQSENPLTIRYRNEATELVRKLASDLGVEFYLKKNNKSKVLRSEEELRDFRHERLLEIMKDEKFELLAFAHQAEDLFETRLIRLIRGTGPEGLASMSKFETNGIWRPLLSESKESICDYADSRKLKWCEDPSNQDPEPFRNWLRLVWLPRLEEKRQGGAKTLARSLEAIVASLKNNTGSSSSGEDVMRKVRAKDGSLKRLAFAQLDHGQKSDVIRSYVRSQGIFKFTSGQILEVVKRLDTKRNDLTFTLLKVTWSINAKQIKAAVRIKSRRKSSH